MREKKIQAIDLLLANTKKFVNNEIIPKALDWERKGNRIPTRVLEELGRLGFFGLLIDSKFGGSGLDITSYAKVTEILATGDCGVANLVNVSNSPVAMAIERYGTDIQKSKYLSALAKGEKRGCFMLSESNSGSDASSIQTMGREAAGGYLINGRKKFVTGGDSASVALVAVKTDQSLGKKGISLFLIPRDSYEVDRLENKMGHKNVDTADVVFRESFVQEGALLGKLGEGYSICLKLLNTGRIGVAAQGVGIALAAFQQARSYALTRKTFGKNLIENQSISFRLTDMATKISGARQLTLLAANQADKGERSVAESSMAKIYASEIAEQVTSDAIQIFGGDGYLEETGVEKLYRDARVLSIYEGSNEIQRIVMSREIEKGWSPDHEN